MESFFVKNTSSFAVLRLKLTKHSYKVHHRIIQHVFNKLDLQMPARLHDERDFKATNNIKHYFCYFLHHDIELCFTFTHSHNKCIINFPYLATLKTQK